LAISNFIALICSRKSAEASAVSSSFDFIGQMYKVFINHRIIYLAENIDHSLIDADDQPLECTNRLHVEKAFSNFLLKPSKSILFLFCPGDSEKLFKLFSSLFLFIEAAGGLVKDPLNRLLFIQRLGFWDLPKGKIEKGEDATMAALREVSEETGLNNLKLIRPLPETYHMFERKDRLRLKRTYWFEMESETDGPLFPQLEEDITDARWFKREDIGLPLSNTYPAIRELVEGLLVK
jgi:8-oxo-dGTP pyrophosphatase MutT (NUDIX family)